MSLNFQKGNNVNILACIWEMNTGGATKPVVRDGDTMNITFCTFNRK